METVDSSLLSFVFSTFPKGTVFFAEDLELTGIPPEAIRFSLSRLVASQSGVIRLGRGVYCVPDREPVSGKILYPPMETIAEALAGRWKVRIAPCGARAAYLSGFSGVDAFANTYVSDGSDQVFNLFNGNTIRFTKRKSQKVFSFVSPRMRNLVEALRYLGREAVGPEVEAVTAAALSGISDEDFRLDVRLAPAWIRKLLTEIRQG